MRNTIIDNLRGICMLGVIGIHIAAWHLPPTTYSLLITGDFKPLQCPLLFLYLRLRPGLYG